jgi:Bacterial SH3 domain.
MTTPQWTAQVRLPTVNVRAEPDGEVVGMLTVGKRVTVLKCVDNWCKIAKPAGWIFRGCLSDNPDNLGCTAK